MLANGSYRSSTALSMGLVLAACGQPRQTVAIQTPPAVTAVAPIDAPEASQDEKLAAIQKAMNELDEAAQGCWAAAAVARFDIEGELTAQIEIAAANAAPTTAETTIVRDTARTPKLAACLVQLLDHYAWAPPLHGQTIQLPFKFTAPDGQSVIDRRLVPWAGQGKVSIAVLLDENNTGNPNAAMFEIAIAAGGSTGLRAAETAELWYFLGDAQVSSVALKKTVVGPHDMMYVPAGGAREVAATTQDVHAVIVTVPGGRAGSARAGALPTREVPSVRAAPAAPIVLPAGGSAQWCLGSEAGGTRRDAPVGHGGKPSAPCGDPGGHLIFVEPSKISAAVLSASEAAISKGAKIPEHVHVKETELLYILSGAGTMTIGATEVAVGPTSVVQIPPGTKHAFSAGSDLRALQIYTPAGPEQRFKMPSKKP